MINWINTAAGQASEGHRGHVVEMRTTHSQHYDNRERRQAASDDVSTSFSDMLRSAVGNVNNLQVESEGLMQQMIHQPESVDIHSVMIAAQKAEVSLSFTKAVRDEAIRAFRELINLR